jgi:hypothetical protein
MKVISYSYSHLKSKYHTANLGDAIQSLSVIEFLKKKSIDFSGFVDRKKLENNMFINGWQKYPNENLPNDALFCSIHSDIDHLKKINKKYLIGCRDVWTHFNCKKIKLNSVVTGCVTINLPKICIDSQNKIGTIFIDSIYKDKNQYTQFIDVNLSWEKQIELAKNRLFLISQADLVHTTRLHILIPCIAMGIPVILDEIPGEKQGWIESKRFSHIQHFIKIKKPIEITDGTRETLLEIWQSNSEKVLECYFNGSKK